MKLNDIHYFIVIAEEKNISQAASRLYISQPALSQFYRSLNGNWIPSCFLVQKAVWCSRKQDVSI